jgi:hypothetical protein
MLTYFRLNEPDVSAECFDGEVIAVNLKSGHYHSLRGVAFLIWTLLIKGHSLETIAATVAGAYPGQTGGVDADLRKFVSELEAAELVVATTAPVETPTTPPDPPAVAGTYAGPVLESFTDMQELLLIDPIHEVDVLAGWPRKPDAADPT